MELPEMAIPMANARLRLNQWPMMAMDGVNLGVCGLRESEGWV